MPNDSRTPAIINPDVLVVSEEVRILQIYAGHSSRDEEIRGALRYVLKNEGGNQHKAARAVGVPRTTFRSWMKKYEVV